MSVSTEGGHVAVAMLRAAQPTGAVFSLGWVMAQLFDPRRRVSTTVRKPPFNAAVQLPLVSDLPPDPKLVFLAAELAELTAWFPGLAAAVEGVTAQTGKVKAAVSAQLAARIASAEHAVEQHEGTVTQVQPATVPFSGAALLAAVSGLHQAILDEFAADQERLSAYQLGLALSDQTWLPYVAAPGQDPDPAASRPSALLGLFTRPQLATLKTLLSGAGTQLPPAAAAAVSRSLDNWADWLDINTTNIQVAGDEWSPRGPAVLHALRVQGWVWRAVLVSDPEVSTSPSMGAWVQAAASIARASRQIAAVVLRRFWPLVLLALAVLGLLLWVVFANLRGEGQVWASLVTVAAVLGGGGYGISSGMSQSFTGVGYEIWSAAKLDAAAWAITWLPALAPTRTERARMDGRGMSAPQLRRNLDVAP